MSWIVLGFLFLLVHAFPYKKVICSTDVEKYSLSFVHTQIYDELAIHVDGLISLPFEVAKLLFGNVLSLFRF
jgi:hypothetical protein